MSRGHPRAPGRLFRPRLGAALRPVIPCAALGNGARYTPNRLASWTIRIRVLTLAKGHSVLRMEFFPAIQDDLNACFIPFKRLHNYVAWATITR